MTDFLTIMKLTCLSTFWCVGIYMNRDKGDAFYFLMKLTEGAPDVIAKPVIRCINCMASIHSAIVMVIYDKLVGLPTFEWWRYFLLWLIVAIMVAGINGIVWNVYSWLEEYISALQRNNFEEEDTKVD